MRYSRSRPWYNAGMAESSERMVLLPDLLLRLALVVAAVSQVGVGLAAEVRVVVEVPVESSVRTDTVQTFPVCSTRT